MAAALHFDLNVHNFGIQEHMGHTRETDLVFPHAHTLRDGAMHPATGPALEWNSTKRLPRRTSLPARLSAGRATRRRNDPQLVAPARQDKPRQRSAEASARAEVAGEREAAGAR